MCVGICAPCYATEKSSGGSVIISETIAQIKEVAPNAEVKVANDTLHIVLNDYSELTALISSSQSPTPRFTGVVSSVGGTFKNFSTPGNALMFPITQVYMNEKATEARITQLLKPSFYNWACELAAGGYSAIQISKEALKVYGYDILPGVVTVLVSLTMVGVTNMDRWALEDAQAKSSVKKTCVTFAYTSDGLPTYLYLPWNDDVCSTFGGYDADWYRGVYNF